MTTIHEIPTGDLLDELSLRCRATFAVMWEDAASIALGDKPATPGMVRGDFRLFVRASGPDSEYDTRAKARRRRALDRARGVAGRVEKVVLRRARR